MATRDVVLVHVFSHLLLSFARSSWDLHRSLRQSEQSRSTPPDQRERPGVRPEDAHHHGLVQLRVGGKRVQVRRGRCVHAGCGGI